MLDHEASLRGLITLGFLGLLSFGVLELAARTVFFPEWVGLSPRTIGANPYFGTFTLPDLNIRRFSPANYDVVNTTNRFGFRDRREGFEADLNGVWVFGDSNTFGMGLDDGDIYTAFMDKAGLPTANLAGLGLNLQQDMRIFAKLIAMGYRPKAVLMAMTMNFSPMPKGPETTEVVKVETPLPTEQLNRKLSNVTRTEVFSFLSIKSILLRNVALYGWVKTRLVSIPRFRDRLHAMGLVQDVDMLSRGPAWMTDISRRAEVEAAAETLVDQIATMRVKVGEAFAVLLLPNHHHLYPVRFNKYLTQFGLSTDTQDAAQPYAVLKAALGARQIAIVEVLDDLRAAEDPQLIFFNDAHFNDKGHRVIAKAVSRWVRAK